MQVFSTAQKYSKINSFNNRFDAKSDRKAAKSGKQAAFIGNDKFLLNSQTVILRFMLQLAVSYAAALLPL
jgi:hypothetical protein